MLALAMLKGRFGKYLLLAALALLACSWVYSVYSGFIKTKQDVAVAMAAQEQQRQINLQVKRDASIFKDIFDDPDGSIADESERLLDDYRGRFVGTTEEVYTETDDEADGNGDDRLQSIVSDPRPPEDSGEDNPVVVETGLREADHFTADDLEAIAEILSEAE